MHSFYREDEDTVNGSLLWHHEHTDSREWLKKMATLIKEPTFTSYTNIKLCVDYIFYQGEGLNVARVLDLPNYSKYLKDNIMCTPHPLIPSDHFSLVADFYIEE